MYQRSALSLETAIKGIKAMLKEAAKDTAHRFAMAVVDERGELIYFAREDGCSQFHNEMAIKKAYSASRGSKSRDPQRDSGWKEEGLDHTMFALGTSYTYVGGGVPVIKAGEETKGIHRIRECLGAVGVSGASQDEDERIALVGVKTIQDTLWPAK